LAPSPSVSVDTVYPKSAGKGRRGKRTLRKKKSKY